MSTMDWVVMRSLPAAPGYSVFPPIVGLHACGHHAQFEPDGHPLPCAECWIQMGNEPRMLVCRAVRSLRINDAVTDRPFEHRKYEPFRYVGAIQADKIVRPALWERTR